MRFLISRLSIGKTNPFAIHWSILIRALISAIQGVRATFLADPLLSIGVITPAAYRGLVFRIYSALTAPTVDLASLRFALAPWLLNETPLARLAA